MPRAAQPTAITRRPRLLRQLKPDGPTGFLLPFVASLRNWLPRRLQRALTVSITHLRNLRRPTTRTGPPDNRQGSPRPTRGAPSAAPGFRLGRRIGEGAPGPPCD